MEPPALGCLKGNELVRPRATCSTAGCQRGWLPSRAGTLARGQSQSREPTPLHLGWGQPWKERRKQRVPVLSVRLRQGGIQVTSQFLERNLGQPRERMGLGWGVGPGDQPVQQGVIQGRVGQGWRWGVLFIPLPGALGEMGGPGHPRSGREPRRDVPVALLWERKEG